MKNIESLIKEGKEVSKCKSCKFGFEKYKLTSHYLINNNEFQAEALIDILDFNDKFLIDHIDDKYKCKDSNRRNTKYCRSWIEEFKKYIEYDK